MDFKIPEEFVFRLNSAMPKIFKSQFATSRLGINCTLNFLFWQTEKLEITNCDIKLVTEIVPFYPAKNNHTVVRLKIWKCQIGTSKLASQYTEKPVI